MGAADNGMEVQQSGDWDDWRQVGYAPGTLQYCAKFVMNSDLWHLTILHTHHKVVISNTSLQGECLLPALVGKFYDQQSYTDVTFQLADGSSVQVMINKWIWT